MQLTLGQEHPKGTILFPTYRDCSIPRPRQDFIQELAPQAVITIRQNDSSVVTERGSSEPTEEKYKQQ